MCVFVAQLLAAPNCSVGSIGVTSVETWNFSDFFSTISSIQSES